MHTKLLIATAAAVALLAGGASAQLNTRSNFSESRSVNPMPLLMNGATPGNAMGLGSVQEPVQVPSVSVGPVNPSPMAAPPAAGPVNPEPATAAPDASLAPAAAAPIERAPAASLGGTDVISSGPVPDTAANRAKYGQPMSNAGRMTKPAGN